MRSRHLLLLPVPLLALCLLPATWAQAPAATPETAAEAPADSDDVKKLKEQNSVLEQLIKQWTNQKNLAGLMFPTIPAGPEGVIERSGDVPIESTAAAHEALSVIAARIAAQIGGPAAAAPAFAEADCDNLEKKVREGCRQFIQWHAANKKQPAPTPRAPITLNKQIILYGEREVQAELELQVFDKQIQVLIRRLEDTLRPPSPPSTPASVRPGVLSVPVPPQLFIGPALQAAVDIAKLFRKDVSTVTTTLNVDENVLAMALVNALKIRNSGAKIVYPAVLPPNLTTADSQVITELARLDGLMSRIAQKIVDTTDAKATLDSDIATKSTSLATLQAGNQIQAEEIKRLEDIYTRTAPAQQPAVLQQITDNRAALKVSLKSAADLTETIKTQKANSSSMEESLTVWKALYKNIDDFRNSLSEKPAGSGSTYLARMLQSEKTRKVLKEGGYSLQLKINRVAAGVKTEKTAFRTKENILAGASASFALFDLSTGAIAAANTFTETANAANTNSKERGK